ncbi:MAG: hypothetical protein AAF950_01540 [Pseudomonadota bacterium]
MAVSSFVGSLALSGIDKGDIKNPINATPVKTLTLTISLRIFWEPD